MIIAEACQNHRGDTDLLREMVAKAAEAGSQFCKIQTFFADDLGPNWKDEYDRLKGLELDWQAHKRFVQWCCNDGVIPMTSVYTKRYIPQLWEAGFRYIKIGSAQCDDEDLIKSYLTVGFKVVVSTGGHRLKDIPKIGPLFGVLHCVSKYPCPPEEADLLRMLELRKHWGSTPIGFSDHTDPRSPNWDRASKVSLFLGGTIVERHFTLLPRNETKDGPVSISFDQLKELCRFDKLSQEDKLKEHPELGLLVCAKDKPEIDIIRRYKDRWKR